jgi:hypothetical protein
MLLRCGPRQDLSAFGPGHVIGLRHDVRVPLDDDAPALLGIVVVGLERDARIDLHARELRSLSRAHDDRVPLHDEIDWKDVGFTRHDGDEAAEVDAGQCVPAGVLIETGDGSVKFWCSHVASNLPVGSDPLARR